MSRHLMCVHMFSGKKRIFYVSRVKKINFDAPTWLQDIFLSFLYMSQKIFFHRETFCANVKHLGLYAKFLLRIFWHFEKILKIFYLIGADAPMCRIASSPLPSFYRIVRFLVLEGETVNVTLARVTLLSRRWATKILVRSRWCWTLSTYSQN